MGDYFIIIIMIRKGEVTDKKRGDWLPMRLKEKKNKHCF